MQGKHPGSAAESILAVLRDYPEGLDIHQIMDLCPEEGNQAHFTRRLRELYPFHRIARSHEGRRFVYRYLGPKAENEWDRGEISARVRAQVLHQAGGKCRMCGRSIADDGVKLVVDHKIPRSWGGLGVADNLWGICEECNAGKKNYFASYDSLTMKTVLAIPSVHERILLLLALQQGAWVSSDLIEFVANFDDWQQDWQKRLRELRYFGLDIASKRHKVGKRFVSMYRLDELVDKLPPDLSHAAREYERTRAAINALGGAEDGGAG